jgi:hypothetical protein
MRLDLRRQRNSFDVGQGSTSASHTPIKSEPGDLSQNFPYRFSPSPDSAQASPYLFPPQTPASASYHDHPMSYGATGNGGNSSGEGSVGSSSYSPYLQTPGTYHSDAGADPRYRSHASDSRADLYCPCHANPNASAVLIGLSQQLHGAVGIMRGLQEHSGHTPCALTRRMQELSDYLQ